MPLAIRPSFAPDREIDLTHTLTRAIAEELWRAGGGNDVLNWMEAERFVQAMGLEGPEAKPRRTPRALSGVGSARRSRTPRRDPDRITGPLPL